MLLRLRQCCDHTKLIEDAQERAQHKNEDLQAAFEQMRNTKLPLRDLRCGICYDQYDLLLFCFFNSLFVP